MERRGQIEQSRGSHSPESVVDLAGPELVQAVFRAANTLLASPTDAEEVALDALVQLHKKLTELQAEAGDQGLAGWLESLPAWLDKVAVSKAKGRAPKRKRHTKALDELAHLHEQTREREPPEQVTALLVKELLTYLPGRHRFVYLLARGLGHTPARVAELLHLEEDAVIRTLDGVESKLREFGAHAPVAKAMVADATGDSPLHDYMQVFGGPDEATGARIRRRFESYLSEGAGHHELSGDSFHAGQFSGSHYRLDAITRNELERVEPVEPVEPGPAPAEAPGAELELGEPELGPRPGQRVGWVVAALASVAAVALGVSLTRAQEQIEQCTESLGEASAAASAAQADDGPVLLEPGIFVELEHGSRAEPSKDATAKLLRSDAKGAEFELSAGSISLHVKKAKGVTWTVHAGLYDITAIGTRFRVIHTDSVPEVEVFQGKVRVTGGLLGADGVEINSASHTLATVMSTRQQALEPMVQAVGDDEELAALDKKLGRALALRDGNPDEAEELLRDIIDLGRDDWVSERAFEQLRTLVAPDQREALRVVYVERFGDGLYAEPFGALGCQALVDEEASECWTAFAETFPGSLYGP